LEHLTTELDGVPASNVLNYDETNLTDNPGNKLVITKHGCKYPERMLNSTKTATMFCGNAEDEVVSAKQHIFSCTSTQLDGTTRLDGTRLVVELNNFTTRRGIFQANEVGMAPNTVLQ